MPVISSFFGILIKMFFADHAPPHFHAEYGVYKCLIGIKDFAIVEGYLPPRALSLVIEWASQHQEELMGNWKVLSENEKGKFNKIEPLK